MKNYTSHPSWGLLRAALIAAIISSGAVSKAQSPESQGDTIGHLLNELKVDAFKNRRDIQSTAASHSINQKDINSKAISDVGDAIRRLPGIMLRDYGGTGAMKTISVRGLGSQHTGIAYDGAPLSDVQTGQIDLSRYSLDYLNEMGLTIGDNENIFIPARMAAASSSLFLSTFSDNLSVDNGYRLTARIKGGSFGFINPSFHTSYGNGKNFVQALTGDFTYARNNFPYSIRNGAEYYKSRRQNSDINSGHGEYNFLWRSGLGRSLTGKLYYFGSFRHLPGPAILYNNENNESLHETNLFAQLKFKSRLSGLFSISLFGKFNWSDTHYSDRDGKYPDGILQNRYLQREAYASVSVLMTPGSGFKMSYSIDYFYNDLRSNSINVNHPFRNSLLQSLAATYKVWRLKMTALALLSLYSDKTSADTQSAFNSRVSPSFGLSIQPLEDIGFYIRANYKNIFRMPTFNELYFDHYGTVNLKPEITEQFNAGISYELTGIDDISWLDKIVMSADGYFNSVKNKIVAIPYNMFVWTMTNLGRVHAYGIDGALSVEFIPHMKQKIIFSGNYSWQRALGHTSPEYLDWNKQVPYIPVHSGAFSLVWENPWLSIGGKATGCGERYTTTANLPSSRIPGYMDFGFMAYHIFSFKKHQIELRADLLNAFNRNYEIISRYPMPGRSWLASIKFTL